jgi:hypothetical protein
MGYRDIGISGYRDIGISGWIWRSITFLTVRIAFFSRPISKLDARPESKFRCVRSQFVDFSRRKVSLPAISKGK